MEEIWIDIKDYEGLYQTSNLGRARSLDRWVKSKNGSLRFCKGRILKPSTNKDGYLKVNLYKNNKLKNFRVNRLVAEAFLEIPEELKHLKGTHYLQVNHKDENKQNNVVSNLEWCSSSYNINFGTRAKRVAKKMTNGKLSKPVLQYDLEGNFIKEWASIAECGRNGFNSTGVWMCCKGTRPHHKNFIWKYK